MTSLRRFTAAVVPLALLVGGCGHAPHADTNSSVDINEAAQQAQGDIDTYASNALQTPSEAATSTPPPLATADPTLAPPAPGEPGGLPDDRTPVSEAPFAPDSAQGAANVVQTYFALIEAGKYRQAWLLWGQHGKASGLSAEAFAASFARYSEYHANIGAPGRIDAGAGQRYVTVPVQVYGRLKDGGRPFNLRGTITLHRTGDIDGTTAEDRTWRISSSDLPAAAPKPSARDDAPAADTPDTETTLLVTAAADYRCADGSTLHVAFDNRASTATLSVAGTRAAVMNEQRAGSGIWYSGEGYTLRGKGNEAEVTRPGKPAIHCTA